MDTIERNLDFITYTINFRFSITHSLENFNLCLNTEFTMKFFPSRTMLLSIYIVHKVHIVIRAVYTRKDKKCLLIQSINVWHNIYLRDEYHLNDTLHWLNFVYVINLYKYCDNICHKNKQHQQNIFVRGGNHLIKILCSFFFFKTFRCKLKDFLVH